MLRIDQLHLPRGFKFRARISHLRSLLRQRRDLSKLDDHMLNDIGVSPAERDREVARSVWDAPHHWLRF